MVNPFPVVGVLGSGYLSQMLLGPASALGIDLRLFDFKRDDLQAVREFAKKCDVVTFEGGLVPISVVRTLEGDGVVVRPSSHSLEKLPESVASPEGMEIAVHVARSPHSQASVWAPTQIFRKDDHELRTESPAQEISQAQANDAQRIALEFAQQISLVGVMGINLLLMEHELVISSVVLTPQSSGVWTIDGSRTSQFEQHLRAVLDLPLGDTSMTSQTVLVGNVYAGAKSDMYRPYLHLMARCPAMKFHQYGISAGPAGSVGHVCLVGDDLLDLRECISHAVDYMSGEIDE